LLCKWRQWGNNEIVDDGGHINYESHEFTSRDEDAFVREVDVLVRTFVLDIELQSELTRCISNLRNFKKFEGIFNCRCARKDLVFKMRW
jgi:hypothetical protein